MSGDFKDYFSPVASQYATSRPSYPADIFRFVGETAKGRSKVWDCATGNGQAAVDLSDWFEDVYATDASSSQIERAKKRPNIHYSVQLAESTDFPDQYFDVATVAQALHWFDLERFSIELCRVLKPGALFVVWGYAFFSIDDDLDQIFRKWLLDVIRPYWAVENRTNWTGYAGIRLPLTSIPTPKLKMSVEWSLDELWSYVRTWSSVTKCSGAQGNQFLDDAFRALQEKWGDGEQRRTVEMDFHCLAWIND